MRLALGLRGGAVDLFVGHGVILGERAAISPLLHQKPGYAFGSSDLPTQGHPILSFPARGGWSRSDRVGRPGNGALRLSVILGLDPRIKCGSGCASHLAQSGPTPAPRVKPEGDEPRELLTYWGAQIAVLTATYTPPPSFDHTAPETVRHCPSGL
ncbi:hypothetical protein BREVUG8_40159 [Brevundimonas sp. G8]|nr:hypothetical protein BREVUG8_40159 [Brevundimonas sp. G8]